MQLSPRVINIGVTLRPFVRNRPAFTIRETVDLPSDASSDDLLHHIHRVVNHLTKARPEDYLEGFAVSVGIRRDRS